MEESSSADHLNSSLTDLMTSLMVIFILLLLVFVHRTAAKDAAVMDILLKNLLREMTPYGFSEKTIRPDPKDRNAILVIVPDRLMNFETGKSTLRDSGKQFLDKNIPNLAGVLCSEQFRFNIESIVVEGHTDTQRFQGMSAQESQNQNLELSQKRSMEVVRSALNALSGMESNRACFLEKLSATGRGEQEPEATLDESRRVIFRIRVRVTDVDSVRVNIK
jgi:outer membrane protein OmpA-like peptidoglycan-associated protein